VRFALAMHGAQKRKPGKWNETLRALGHGLVDPGRARVARPGCCGALPERKTPANVN
jgi:hypothetical protein